ncbi:MAG: hypothetical protein ABIJ04_09640 [Bacteroidota bacterium]
MFGEPKSIGEVDPNKGNVKTFEIADDEAMIPKLPSWEVQILPSRIIHDYSDEQKGYILWKNLLEQRLF